MSRGLPLAIGTEEEVVPAHGDAENRLATPTFLQHSQLITTLPGNVQDIGQGSFIPLYFTSATIRRLGLPVDPLPIPWIIIIFKQF